MKYNFNNPDYPINQSVLRGIRALDQSAHIMYEAIIKTLDNPYLDTDIKNTCREAIEFYLHRSDKGYVQAYNEKYL